MKNLFKQPSVLRTGISVALALCLAIGGSLLYLTDADSADNVFTVGNVDIELVEPSWDPDAAENLVPNQEVAKDPAVYNAGTTDAIVFLKVTVPSTDFKYSNDDGTEGESDGTLVWLKDADDPIDQHENNLDPNWIPLLLGDIGTSQDLNGVHWGFSSTYYGYKEPLPAGETTTALFEKIQLTNLDEFPARGVKPQTIKVEAFAIQASNVIANGVDLTGELTAESLTNIFNIGAKQGF